MEEREPNPSEDPREQDQGSGGYPEEQQGGDPGGGNGTQDERDTSGAPDTSSPSEGDSGQATGNPDAAG
jgi:hypothetical protein